MRVPFYIGLSLLVLLAFCACGAGGSAEVEKKQAEQSMDEAKNLHADGLAPRDFEQAQKAWDHAQAADKAGKTGTAKVLFSSAQIYFAKAASIAKAKQEDLSRQLNAMEAMISSNLGQVISDLSTMHLSGKQQSQVRAIVSEVEKSNDSINRLTTQGDLLKAVAAAKAVQTKIYEAQLILAGQKPAK